MSRTPASYPLTCVRGSTFEDEFNYTDADGVAIDLTGYEARMQIRTLDGMFGETAAETLIAEYATTDVAPYLTFDTAANGRLVLRVPAADTVVLNPDNERKLKLSYGIEVYVPALNPEPEYVIPLVQGSLTVRGEVVR